MPAPGFRINEFNLMGDMPNPQPLPARRDMEDLEDEAIGENHLEGTGGASASPSNLVGDTLKLSNGFLSWVPKDIRPMEREAYDNQEKLATESY